jgi:hypothetical protein
MSRFFTATDASDGGWQDAVRWAGAFIASFRFPDTRKAYQRAPCRAGSPSAPHTTYIRTTESVGRTSRYLRQLEQQTPPLANATLRRRISTLRSWFTQLEHINFSSRH